MQVLQNQLLTKNLPPNFRKLLNCNSLQKYHNMLAANMLHSLVKLIQMIIQPPYPPLSPQHVICHICKKPGKNLFFYFIFFEVFSCPEYFSALLYS